MSDAGVRNYSFFTIENGEEHDSNHDYIYLVSLPSLARQAEHDYYANDARQPERLWTAINGEPVECRIGLPEHIGTDGYIATLRVPISRADTDEILTHFEYRIDSRA